ncbi:Uncharacterised protein [Moellerella wisconsensis]|nr:Uncharacterised protein [Moellerella wisconsensis]
MENKTEKAIGCFIVLVCIGAFVLTIVAISLTLDYK